jgi:hypothetical protein
MHYSYSIEQKRLPEKVPGKKLCLRGLTIRQK